MPGDDDYMTGRDVRALLTQAAAQQVTPQLNQAIDLAVSSNMAAARQLYTKEFQRFGPEITAKLAAVPKNLWTLDNIETVIKLVKVDHHAELVREEATQLAATMEPTIRSTGAGGSVPVPLKEHSLASDRIPAEWKERAARVGVTEQVVRDFCQANDTTVEAFYKQFDTPRNTIVADIGKVGNGGPSARS